MMMDVSAIIIQTVLEARKILTSYIMYVEKKLIQRKKWACAHQFFSEMTRGTSRNETAIFKLDVC